MQGKRAFYANKHWIKTKTYRTKGGSSTLLESTPWLENLLKTGQTSYRLRHLRNHYFESSAFLLFDAPLPLLANLNSLQRYRTLAGPYLWGTMTYCSALTLVMYSSRRHCRGHDQL